MVPSQQLDYVLDEIKKAKTSDTIDAVKDFFKSWRKIKKKKIDPETAKEAFQKIKDFLDPDQERPTPEEYAEDIEQEFWRRFGELPDSDGISQRVYQEYVKNGPESALWLMDSNGW